MEEKRVQTLDALSEFIQAQRALLERTRGDIEKLRALRDDAVEHPSDNLEGLSERLNDSGFRLSEQGDCISPPLPKELDWAVFASADPSPLRALATTAREAYATRNEPPKTVALSDMRALVRKARATLLDPAIAAIEWPSSDEEEEVDPEEARRARAKAEIMQLKRVRIEHGGGGFARLGLRRPVAGVHILQAQEDESAEVDISMDSDEEGVGERKGKRKAVPDVKVEPEPSPPPMVAVAGPSKKATKEKRANASDARVTKPAGKAKSSGKAKAPPKSAPKAEEPMDLDGEPVEAPGAVPLGKNGKARSETYKQAWSVSEQHLLERLLEEIPEGEKNRWSKISKAMNGRRTARQVASRVQKYYEKLKRFGVELGGGGSKP